jgi:predicted PurR-regulated permease PerM
MSAQSVALERTTKAIEQRVKYYRRHMMVFVGIALLTLVGMIVWRSFSSALTVVFLIPVCALYLFLDGSVLIQWRLDLLTAWERRELEFAAFAEALRADRGLPRETIQGMLLTLPMVGELGMEQRLSTATRQAVAAASQAAHHAQSDVMLLNAIVSAVAASAIVLSIWTWTAPPLLGLAAFVLLPPARWWARRRRWLRCETEVMSFRQQPGFSESDYARIHLEALAWP